MVHAEHTKKWNDGWNLSLTACFSSWNVFQMEFHVKFSGKISFWNVDLLNSLRRLLGLVEMKKYRNLPLPKPWMSERKLSVPRCPSTNWPMPPTKRSPSSRPSYVWSDKSISIPRCTPFGMLYEMSPSVLGENQKRNVSSDTRNTSSRPLYTEHSSIALITSFRVPLPPTSLSFNRTHARRPLKNRIN